VSKFNQPMGGSGVEMDIITGRPKEYKSQEERQAEAQLKETATITEANQILQELHQSPVLWIMARQLESRLVELIRADSECQSLLKVIGSLRVKLDVAPAIARKLRMQAMGPQLTIIAETTPAPEEGIPGEE
jgi:hypothetical protein